MNRQAKPVIVVGADGSELSAKALAWADRYAQATGADLKLVTAWQWASAYGAPMMFDGYDPAADAEAIAEKARAETTLSADRVQIVTQEGSAGPVLVAAGEEAIALVVGSQGHNAISSVLLGSASAYCVHHAACPVVVVR